MLAISSVRCPVLGAIVSRVTDLEGNVTAIVCPEYDEATGNCRLRRTALQGGPLTQLLERAAEGTLDAGGTACLLRET